MSGPRHVLCVLIESGVLSSPFFPFPFSPSPLCPFDIFIFLLCFLSLFPFSSFLSFPPSSLLSPFFSLHPFLSSLYRFLSVLLSFLTTSHHHSPNAPLPSFATTISLHTHSPNCRHRHANPTSPPSPSPSHLALSALLSALLTHPRLAPALPPTHVRAQSKLKAHSALQALVPPRAGSRSIDSFGLG